MAMVAFDWAGRLRSLLVVALLPLVTLACASDDGPRYRSGAVELQIEESWDLLVEEPSYGFFDAVGRNADEYADAGSKGTAVVGCVAGAISLVVLTQVSEAGEAGCVGGGYALYPVGYAMGYGTGALVGTVQGTINAFSEADGEADVLALVAAFETATPPSDLAKALFEESQRVADLAFTWEAPPDEAGGARPHAVREPGSELNLTITRVWLSTTTAVPPTSRLHLTVEGRLSDSRARRELHDETWRYVSEPRSTAKLADRDAEGLKAEMAAGWRTIAGEIVADLFAPEDL